MIRSIFLNCIRIQQTSLVSTTCATTLSANLRTNRFLSSGSSMEGIRRAVDDVIKSDGDKRHYQGLELANGMKVLLISDETTDKASAAMDVNIGFMSEPENLPGLAHFCEHMLFLGTEKYPEENEYQKFLSEHSGSANAYTSSENTNYYFDVAPEHLRGALDRFSQFFVSPLFTASATEREVNAVNSENDKNLASDMWRLNQLGKSMANPSHAFSRFGTGNKDTLLTIPRQNGLDTREELLKYHNKFYSSNIMGLAILGKDSLEELRTMVVELFSNVKNKNVETPEWLENPYGSNELKKICYAAPIKDVRKLSVSWNIPDVLPYYKSLPVHYLGHLVGHEGPGSLLSELKAKGWVNTLVAGQKGGAKGFDFFYVSVDLTEDGIEHVDDIIILMYQYITLLRKEGPQEWVFKECQDLSAMHFRFKDKESPQSYTTHISTKLQEYPLQEVLSVDYLYNEWRADLIEMLLAKLVPDNMRVSVVGKKYEPITDKKEKWYGTDYKLENIDEKLMQRCEDPGLHENLKLPEPNEFIPTNFDILPRETEDNEFPQLIKNSNLTRLWFKQDQKFLLPKSYLSMDFISPMAYMSPLHANLLSLFVKLFNDALNEYSYNADLAGLHYDLRNTMYGMYLGVKGYNHKQPVLLKKVMEKLTTFEIDRQRYDIIKESYERGLKNFYAEQPYTHAIYYNEVVLAEQLWTKDELIDSLDDVTLERLQAMIKEFLSRMCIECLVYGNVTQGSASEVVSIVEDILQEGSKTKSLPVSQLKQYRECQLPDGCSFVYSKDNTVHKSSAILIFYQTELQQTHSNMQLELFCQLIQEPCFNILRTKEQLGYIVFSGIRRANGVQGLRVIVQSDRSPEYVEKRVEAFLHSMQEYISSMEDEVFTKHVTALATKRLEKPKKLSIQNGRYWSEIVCQQYNFDRDNIEAAHLKTITKEDILQFYNGLICHSAPRRHKLAIHIPSTLDNGTDNTDNKDNTDNNVEDLNNVPDLPLAQIIENVAEFKKDLPLYPRAKPFLTLPAHGVAPAKSKL